MEQVSGMYVVTKRYVIYINLFWKKKNLNCLWIFQTKTTRKDGKSRICCPAMKIRIRLFHCWRRRSWRTLRHSGCVKLCELTFFNFSFENWWTYIIYRSHRRLLLYLDFLLSRWWALAAMFAFGPDRLFYSRLNSLLVNVDHNWFSLLIRILRRVWLLMIFHQHTKLSCIKVCYWLFLLKGKGKSNYNYVLKCRQGIA
jgi:hypothetical protein